MDRRWMVGGRLAIVALAVQVACDGPAVPPYDRAALLSDLVDGTILPGQRALADRSSTLRAAVDELCLSIDAAHLDVAQQAWIEALLAWQRTAAYRFGPATDRNLVGELAYFPPDDAAVQAAIEGTATLDEAYVASVGGPEKGLFALEPLLFAPDDATVIATLSSRPRACDMARALASHAEATAIAIRDAWDPDGGAFAITLETAGEMGNVTYPAQQSAIGALLAGIYAVVEEVKNDAIGEPIGAMTGGEADPAAVRGRHADVAVRAMRAQIESARAVWSPPGSTHSLDGLLRSRRPELADRLLGELGAAESAVAALPEPFDDYVAGGDLEAATAATDALRTVEVTVRADVSTTLGVSFVGPSDGD